MWNGPEIQYHSHRSESTSRNGFFLLLKREIEAKLNVLAYVYWEYGVFFLILFLVECYVEEIFNTAASFSVNDSGLQFS
jgi:hypothetical protein